MKLKLLQAFLLLVFLGLVSQSEQGRKLLHPLILLASFWFFSFLLLRHQSKFFTAISKGYKSTISGFILYKPKISQLASSLDEARTNKLFLSGAISIFLLILWLYSGTPTGISDTDYNDYKQLSAPKILYSCSKLADITYKNLEEKLKCIREGNTDEECRLEKIVTYKAGVGFAATYNKLLGEAKDECKGENATFKIIESEK